MASLTLKRAAGAWLAALVLGLAASAQAQSPAVNPPEADFAKQQQAQQQSQPLNNQPVWKEVRSGQAQTSTVRGRETNVLIQSQGQTWRAARVTGLDGAGWPDRRAGARALRLLLLARFDRAPRQADRARDRAFFRRQAHRPLGDGADLRRARRRPA